MLCTCIWLADSARSMCCF